MFIGINVLNSKENPKFNAGGESNFDFSSLFASMLIAELAVRDIQSIRLDDLNSLDTTLEDRVKKANANGVDLVINLDTTSSFNLEGVTTFVKAPLSDDLDLVKLAGRCHTAVVQGLEIQDNGVKGRIDYINLNSKSRVIHIELGNFESSKDLIKLRDNKVLAEAASRLALELYLISQGK